ncbi:MAG: tripartite tricarboxylate transporter TctB family protein [Pseudomonadota bacterium]
MMGNAPQSDTRSRYTRRALALVIILFSAAAIWTTTTFERVPPILKRGIQPSDFPQLIAGLMIGLALLMVVVNRDRAPEPLKQPTYLSLALLVAFIGLVQIDFFLALAVFAAAMAAFWGERRPLMLATVGIAVPVAVFFLFDLVFRIRFPRGLLTSLWYG